MRRTVRMPVARRPAVSKESTNAAFITGGIGDVISVESHLSDTEKNVDSLYLASPRQKAIESMLTFMNFPNLTLTESLWHEWSERHSFASKIEFLRVGRSCNVRIPPGARNASDWSISRIFNEIRRGKRTFRPSALLSYKRKRPILGEPYVAIAPSSIARVAELQPERSSFTKDDWLAAIEFLDNIRMTGIILSKEVVRGAPKHINLTDWSGRLELMGMVEAIAEASYFLGLDSWPAVVASQTKARGRIAVVSISSMLYEWAPVYYAPHKTIDWVCPTLRSAIKTLT